MMLTLHDPKKTREQYSSGAWQQDTMFMLLRENARKKGDADANDDDPGF